MSVVILINHGTKKRTSIHNHSLPITRRILISLATSKIICIITNYEKNLSFDILQGFRIEMSAKNTLFLGLYDRWNHKNGVIWSLIRYSFEWYQNWIGVWLSKLDIHYISCTHVFLKRLKMRFLAKLAFDPYHFVLW